MSVEKLAYNIREVQQVTGLGRSVIVAAIRRGDLANIRAGIAGLGQGKRILVPADSLKTWLFGSPEGDQ